MISAYRFNYDHLPQELKMGSFDSERSLIFKEIMRLLKDFQLSSSQNWFPINNLLQKFKQIYSLTMEERQLLSEMLLEKIVEIRSVVGFQNAFSLICTIIQNKQKYFNDFKVDWKYWNQFLVDRFMSNTDKSISSQTFTTQLFIQFCQFLRTVKYFFTPDVVDFAFEKFKEYSVHQDRQAAWAYLMLFVPFRTDIPQEKYQQIIDYLMDPLLLLGGDKDNCRLKFILNYLRIYPNGKIEGLMSQMMRFFHGYWRVDLAQDEKNDKLVNMLLPDDSLGVPSLFKLMPQLLVELIGSSKRDGYEEFMRVLRSLFSMIDSITSVYSQATWDDQIFKLIKLIVGNFIFKYRRDQLLLQICQANQTNDEECSKLLIEDLIDQFEDVYIQDFIDSEKYIQELLIVNPDQGYAYFLQNYPHSRSAPRGSTNGRTKVNIQKLKPYLLDQGAKDDFLKIVMSVMDKILYMEDQGYSTAKTVLYLSCFEPKLIDFFIGKMKQAINDVQALPFVTIKSILIFLTIPILQGKNQYSIEQLKEFMEMSFKLFEVQGMTENIDALELYCKIFMNVPVYTPEEYQQLYGEQNELCTFLSDFIIEVFKMIIKNLDLVKYKDVDYGFVLPNLINIFWPYICNSSDRIIDNIVKIILNHIEHDLTNSDLNALGDIMDCIIYRDPQKLIPPIINNVMEKLIKQGTPKEHYLNFIIDESPYKEYIKQCDQTAGNKNQRILWLTLLEKALTYAGSITQQFDKELQTICIIYLFDDEDDVFIKVSDIVHTIILTNQIFKPTNLSWKNNKQEFFQRNFQGRQKEKHLLKELQVDWKITNAQDWDFIDKWNNIFLFSVKKHFEQNYLQNYEHFDLPSQFSHLTELMVFRTPLMNPKLKQQCYRIWFLIFGTFTGSSLFAPFPEQDLDMKESKGHKRLTEFQKEYLNKVCPSQYLNIRELLCEFVIQCVCFAISSGIAHDKDINDLLVTIASECVSCQIINQELQLGREFLEGCRQLNQAGQSKLYFESRIQLVIDINTYAYTRHMFLLFLQGIPILYNKIYHYVIVIYLLGQSEFASPQFLLPYSTNTTYTLTTGIRDNYFTCLLEMMDPNNPESRLSKINSSSDKSKEYKQICDLLNGFNSAVQHMSADILVPIKIQKQLNQFISIMDQIDNQQCKQVITESCVHHLAIQYDENNVQEQGDEAQRMEIIQNSIQALHSQQFWKCKIIHSLSLLNNINITKLVPERCIQAFLNLCIDDHMTLNQLGRAGIFYFLRMSKQQIYKKSQISSDKIQSKHFLQYRYMTDDQLQKVTNSYLHLSSTPNILNHTHPIYRAKMHEKYTFTYNSISETQVHNSNDPYILELRTALTNREFMRKFLHQILVDKDVAHSNEFESFPNDTPSQEVQFMSVQGITKYVQIFFSYIYGKNRVRQSPFSATQSFFMSDFYFRLFKKIFQVCGIDAFLATKDIIDGYVIECEMKEKQRLVSCYLTALHRSLLNVGTYIQDQFIKILPNITQEIFYDYHLAFYYMCRDQDWQWLSPVYLTMLDMCKTMIQQGGFKGLRYIQLLKIIIQSQGPRAINLQQDVLTSFLNILPIQMSENWPSSVYIEEYTCTLATALLQSILVPIPNEIEHPDIYPSGKNFKLYYNPILQQFFKTINEFLSKRTENQLKNYQEVAARILEYIAINKYDIISWSFIKESIQIIFENNNTEIDSQDILRKFIESEYDNSKELVQIAESMTLNEAWLIRKRANWFLRDWYFRMKLEGYDTQGIPESLLNMFEDKNAQLVMQAVNSLSDFLKLFNEDELEQLYKKTQGKERVYILMAMLLSRQDRNYKWTDNSLNEIFQLKKRKLLQEFVSEYWKCRQDSYNLFEQTISEKNLSQLREIVNPHKYFA